MRNATVQHKIRLSWYDCLIKDIRSAWREGRTYEMIAAKGVNVRMSDSTRVNDEIDVGIRTTGIHWKNGMVRCCSQTDASQDRSFALQGSKVLDRSVSRK